MSKVIDLFAGAGGLSLGATRAGFQVASVVELDSFAINTHMLNFPNTRHIHADIMSLHGDDILAQTNIQKNELIGVIGGPPCQGFSNIGHGDVDDPRNALFIKFFELVQELSPCFFLAENVPGILQPKYDDIRQSAFKKIPEYTLLSPIEIKASDFGAPTTRTRVFFIGYKKDERIQPITETDINAMKVSELDKTNVRAALEGLPEIIRYSKNFNGEKRLLQTFFDNNLPKLQNDFFYQRVTGTIPEGIGDKDYIQRYNQKHFVNGCLPTKHTNETKKRFAALKCGKQDKISKSVRLDPDQFCPTLRAGTGPEKGSYQAVRPVHYRCSRVITPREAARLQGFPDWFKLPETIWHSFRQIGNSVSPIAAERVLTAIYQKLTV